MPDKPVPMVNANRLDPNATPEMVLLTKALFGMLVNVLLDPLIDLLVNVWMPVKVATVESIEIVTGVDPLNDPPSNPVPIVNVSVVLEVIVPDDPKATVTPL